LIRALEVILQSGENMSDMMVRRRSPLEGYRFIVIGLAPSREEQIERNEARVKKMFASGWVKEVRWLVEQVGPDSPAFKAIGYREIKGYLDGDLSLDEAERLTVRSTVRYAKRQMTWFRREEGIIWFAGIGDQPEVEMAVQEHLKTQLDIKEEGSLYAKTAS
jgi:tRNA dimethylallyltransferase